MTKRMIELIRNRKGSFSLEAVVAMMFVLMLIYLAISYYVYLVPRQSMTQEVHTLATISKIQGGLTFEDVEEFKNRLVEKGYVEEDKMDEIEVTAVAKGKVNGHEYEKDVIGVEPLSEGYLPHDESSYSHRNSKEIITIQVKIPAKIRLLAGISNFWGSDTSGLKYYHFEEIVMSERW